jgi:Fe2+ transport system protein FeoA
MKNASELNFGEKAVIKDINSSNPYYKRLLEIGFTPGEEIELINTSIFNDPMTFSLRGTLIAIRKKQAESILIS